MVASYYPVEAFDIERVRFFVHGSVQPLQGISALLYSILSRLTGRQAVTLQLVALVDQESAHALSAIETMGKHGAMYLKQARSLARAQGYLVARSEWMGIIHPDNLNALQNAPGWIVWEFPRN